MDYNFNVEEVYNKIREDFVQFANSLNTNKIVLGVSGGKDSTVCSFLASKIFGEKNVYGVMMPCDEQSDIEDSREVIKLTGINGLEINIGDAFHSILNGVENNGIEIQSDTRINLPPRLRMSTLYAVGQSVNGIVLNCDNLSEILNGYYTTYGDGSGSYGPLRDLTVPEVLELGKYLGVQDNLLYKKPGDGLQPLGDEDRMGFTYEEMHNIVRNNDWSSSNSSKILNRYMSNRWKSEMIRIKHPILNLPNYIENRNG